MQHQSQEDSKGVDWRAEIPAQKSTVEAGIERANVWKGMADNGVVVGGPKLSVCDEVKYICTCKMLLIITNYNKFYLTLQ